MAELNWSDSQWQRVNDAVTEAFSKASVASAFLPMYGPLSDSSEVVRNERLVQEPGTATISLNKDDPDVNLRLVTIRANVELSSEQVADESLSNALLAFRRAGNILAQEQDRLIFEGYQAAAGIAPSVFISSNLVDQEGLADPDKRTSFAKLVVRTKSGVVTLGQSIVSAVVAAISTLEENQNPAPFACVLGSDLYAAVNDPSTSLVLPADRLMPMLKGGPLLRSGKMDAKTGIVVSLAGGVVDVVIGTPPTAQFLQRSPDAKFLFRTYLRTALRIRDKTNSPIAGFKL